MFVLQNTFVFIFNFHLYLIVQVFVLGYLLLKVEK